MKEIEYFCSDVGGNSESLDVSLLVKGVETFRPRVPQIHWNFCAWSSLRLKPRAFDSTISYSVSQSV